ncbi:MAG: NAD(P)-binding protein [Candidatus Omnitrophica bacterium]|nr:NAD(P)-binding protein [Candidatus Omnitrophota bacterium]
MSWHINSKSYECCIIGAGPAGLGAACELVKNGVKDILIIDKNKLAGGLARTEVFKGGRFEVGSHRFYTRNEEVNKIWHDTLGPLFKPVRRLSRIYYKDKYFSYPIKPADVLIKTGPAFSLSVIFSFFLSQASKKNEPETFEEWAIKMFGRKLYETFFKTYTEKVWGIPCSRIGAEWAAQRIKGLDVFEVLKNAWFRDKNQKIKTLVDEFHFPELGAGQMYETMCEKLVAQGVEIMLASRVIRFNRQDNTVKSVDVLRPAGEEVRISAKQFFSSVPLTHYFRMLCPAEPRQILDSAGMLRYRDHITVNLLIGRKKVFPEQWIYVHSPELAAARVSNYKNFSEKMVEDKNKTGLSVEYFAFKSDNFWNKTDESLSALAIDELEKMRLIKKGEVEISRVIRETEAYPVYYLGFYDHYNLLKSRVGQFINFYSIGRAGMYKYNNQDHSLISGILAARNYLKLPGSPYALWDINIDAQYHENA